MKIGIAMTFVNGGKTFSNPLSSYSEDALM